MFYNKFTFVMKISNNLRYIMTNNISSKRQDLILDSKNKINNTYPHRYFCITYYNAENKFESLQGGLISLHIKLNMVSEDDHV